MDLPQGELVMATFLHYAPTGITRPAARLAALRAHPTVALVISSEPQPPEVLTLRGDVGLLDFRTRTPEIMPG